MTQQGLFYCSTPGVMCQDKQMVSPTLSISAQLPGKTAKQIHLLETGLARLIFQRRQRDA